MNITAADVDNNYNNFIAAATSGVFNTVCHIHFEGFGLVSVIKADTLERTGRWYHANA